MGVDRGRSAGVAGADRIPDRAAPPARGDLARWAPPVLLPPAAVTVGVDRLAGHGGHGLGMVGS
ncbi:hypothetical protein STRIP9103_09461 [Streptomyces ipomoeae 91-03]|uniref:Uncharacterized protein n=1 Tax=Streptomyces ipomoeae 91-03 TaxID=698759 RepID=L1KH71_9ACTN|nr:hypothetical protein STRIP9103_09461 [Streptomyces ipomoeae 91-03]